MKIKTNAQQARRMNVARLFLVLSSLFIGIILLFQTINYLFSLQRPSISLAASPQSDPALRQDKEGILNLNDATVEQLDSLPGIGPVLAQAILDFRNENEVFYFIEELMDVPGIGEKKFEAIRPMIDCLPVESP